jgi:hypothetical protein
MECLSFHQELLLYNYKIRKSSTNNLIIIIFQMTSTDLHHGIQ